MIEKQERIGKGEKRILRFKGENNDATSSKQTETSKPEKKCTQINSKKSQSLQDFVISDLVIM